MPALRGLHGPKPISRSNLLFRTVILVIEIKADLGESSLQLADLRGVLGNLAIVAKGYSGQLGKRIQEVREIGQAVSIEFQSRQSWSKALAFCSAISRVLAGDTA
jgi:hypothetical protein